MLAIAAWYSLILIISALIEIFWVASVKGVEDRSVCVVVIMAVTIPAISYVGVLVVVNDRLAIIPALIGHGLGAWLVMRRIVSRGSGTGRPTR